VWDCGLPGKTILHAQPALNIILTLHLSGIQNCAIKPPAPIVLRDRHRRLCISCTKAPLGSLVKPRLDPDVSLESDDMQRAICRCDSDGVWLCQPCGRSIRGDDYDYKRWVNIPVPDTYAPSSFSSHYSSYSYSSSSRTTDAYSLFRQ